MVDFGCETHWLRLEKKGFRDDSRPIPNGVIQESAWRIDKFSWVKSYSQIKQLRALLDRLKPDIIHAGPVHKTAALAAFAKADPLISMSWGYDLLLDAQRSLIDQWLAGYTLKHSHAFIGDCQAVFHAALELGYTAQHSAIFPWGIDLKLFNPEKRGFYRRQLGHEGEIIFLCTRAFEPLYGVHHVLGAFAKISQKIKHTRLFLLGDGSQREYLKGLAKKLHIEDRVFFLGKRGNEELAAYYLACDFYLSASYSDGSSVSLMEALACGLPPIVSDLPANREWILHGENGWLFPVGDEIKLAELVFSILENRESVQKVHIKARETAVELADWSKNKLELMRLYESLVRYSKENEQ